jgi:methylase of polypeptide subunit release factors
MAPLVDACLWERGKEAKLVTAQADQTKEIRGGTVQLVVTSPPFLDVVNYKQDNWLRCWFNGIDPEAVEIWHFKKPEEWQDAMRKVLKELKRVLRPGGFVAFEVGEVRNGSILLEDLVVPAGQAVGLTAEAVLINDQKFTKTSNCWGVDNLKKGTNTNRIILFSRPR